MFSSIIHPRPLKITCDAPATKIIKASESVGMLSPQDVRWRRQGVQPVKRKSLARRIWRLLFAFGVPDVEETCRCGHALPERRFIRLRKRSGAEVRYALTQCSRCRTIVWDQEREQRGVK